MLSKEHFLLLGGCLELLLSLWNAFRDLSRNPVRIPRSKIGELALQAQSAGIFAKRIPGAAPDFSPQLGHVRGKTPRRGAFRTKSACFHRK